MAMMVMTIVMMINDYDDYNDYDDSNDDDDYDKFDNYDDHDTTHIIPKQPPNRPLTAPEGSSRCSAAHATPQFARVPEQSALHGKQSRSDRVAQGRRRRRMSQLMRVG